MLVVKHDHVAVCLLLLLLVVRSAFGYLLVVSDTDSPGLVLFDGGTPFYDRPARRYALNPEKSGDFVAKLLRVDHYTGSVILERPLECDGFKYPDVFTFYVDSTSNDTLEYMSVPLRMVIKGCEKNKIDSLLNTRIEHAKKWSSKTLVSVVLSVLNLKFGTGVSMDEVNKKCWRQSEFVAPLGSSVIPQSVYNDCKIRYLDISDNRFSVESKSGDLVVAENFCSTLDPMSIIVMISYECDVNSEIVSPSEHYIKMILWHKRSVTETGRVRREVEMADSGLQFERSLYVASVAEELPSGTIVCSVHARSMPPNNNPIEYQMSPIIDTRSHAMFTIDSNSGLVTTLVSLDREFMDVHYLRVIAIDTSSHPSTATTTLQVNVVDANDHSPVFESASGMYEASVRESVSVGTTIITIRATDLDIGVNSQIEYSVESISGGGINSSADETFGIDLRSGVVSVRRNLDREVCEVYTVMVKASDQAAPPSPRRSAIASLVVKVLDDNDNYPQFSERAYTANVPEDLNPNQRPVISTIKATDADQGLNAVVRYAIIGGNTQGQFSIDSQNGEVSLVKSLDYEAMRSYRLMIRAQDGGNPSRSNTTQLLVNVKDVNDNPPRFYTSLFQESVLENVAVGYSIVRVQAYDADEGENAALKYRIFPRDFEGTLAENLPITVDEKSGWVYTTHLLDRETNPKYQFQVVAEDGGDPPKSATASVVVTIQDVNDNEPIFHPKQYDVVISEDSPPGTPLTTVMATDPDENPRLHYEIVSGNLRGRFAIATHSGKGLVTIAQPLDYKQEKRFILSVTATDSGGLSDTATIYVNVTDANNFAPIFDNAPYTASIYEDSPVGSTVLVVSATDGDVGQNALITYSLASGYGDASEFTINAQSGAIVTTKALDREVQSGYLLTVTARDGGNPPLSDTTDVEISITDINDNAPQFFNASYYGSVSEDALTGTSVLQVSASDADSGLNGRIKYALDDGVEAFVIDPTSGILRTAASLDRESIPQYNIHVFAIDKGSPSLSTAVPVTIRIEDVNDSPPVFESDKLVMYIPENSPIGSTVGELYAKDPDEGPNAIVQYSIIGGDDASSFSLLRRPGLDKAELLTSVELDYESNKKKFELVVRASSPPLHSDAPLTIYLTDVNDNAPRLSDFQVIFNNFKDFFPTGTFGQVPAFDADVSDKLIYRIISGNNANLVQLNESTGMLTLSSQLNTNVPKIASMEISVTDGVNEIKATMTLIVRLVTDEMLFNSVTVRLADMTKEAFLSPLLEFFTSGLAAIIPCPKENIYVFSVQDDTDVDGRVLNVSFSAKQPDGIFYSPQFLQERVYLNRGILTRLSTVQLNGLETKSIKVTTFVAVNGANSLHKAVNSTQFLHGSDVLIGQQLLQHLLSHEGSLSGLNLTHSQDKDYILNLVMASSRLLDLSEIDHWERINSRTSQGPFNLMNTINNYVATLSTTQHDTYTDPFKVVSPNIAIGLDVVSAESLFGFEHERPDLSTSALTEEKVNLPDSSILQPAIQVLSLKPGSEILGLKNMGSPVVVLPKYNNYLLDSSKFDKHTQIMVPIDLLGIEPIKHGMTTTKGQLSKNAAVVGYTQYRTLGALLPLRYDDTVLKRYSVDLQVGSPVISFVATLNHNNPKRKQRHVNGKEISELSDMVPLDSPIRIKVWINKNPVTLRSNPQCVRWSTSRVPSGEWTRAGCHTELPEDNWWKKDPIYINCTCNQLSTYAVLTDVVDEHYIVEYSNVELFSILVSFGLAIIALIVTCVLLVAVRAGTNTSSIYSHFALCLLLTQCVYLAATQTRGTLYTFEIWCKFCSITLHYLWLATIGWSLVAALHLYRMLTELRDVNHGQMGFYHSIGYVLPAIIVSLSVGVRINQYGNYYFCWLSVYESVVWSLIGPTCLAVAITVIVLLLCIRAAFTLKDHVLGYGNLRSVLVVQVICVPILVGVWLLEVVVASERDTRLTYTLCAAVCSQGWLVLAGLCYSNAKLRCGIHHCALRLIGKEIPEKNEPDSGIGAISPPTIRSSLSYRNTGITTTDGVRRPIGISMSSTTSRSTTKTSSSPYRSDTQLRNTSTTTSNYDHSTSDLPSSFHRTQHTSDSDSEGSGEGRSLDLASSHSSDEDDSSRHRGRRSNTSSNRPPPFLPNINEDPGLPPSLNVITNSQLFPNLKPLYAPRWTSQQYPTVQEEDHAVGQHRWTGSTISDQDNSVINNRMSLEPPLLNSEHFGYHLKSSTFNSLNKTESDCDVDDKASLGDKYLFPYTAEEDHCHSPYRDLYGDNRRGSDLYGISMPPPMVNRGSENGSLHSVDSRFVTARAYSQPVSPSTHASTSTLNLQSRHGYTNEYGIQEILESEKDSSETPV